MYFLWSAVMKKIIDNYLKFTNKGIAGSENMTQNKTHRYVAWLFLQGFLRIPLEMMT